MAVLHCSHPPCPLSADEAVHNLTISKCFNQLQSLKDRGRFWGEEVAHKNTSRRHCVGIRAVHKSWRGSFVSLSEQSLTKTRDVGPTPREGGSRWCLSSFVLPFCARMMSDISAKGRTSVPQRAPSIVRRPCAE